MIKTILTDIEGTTSSLSFVKDVLFPHARRNIAGFLEKHFRDTELEGTLKEIRDITGEDLDISQTIGTLIQWMDQDMKITPLKTLQGMIWEEGYRNGDFYGHIYPDAKTCLEKWKAEGLELYVYSSGSIFAQKLLFAHTEFGDLTGFFSGYFDTTTGQKRNPESYRRIASHIGRRGSEVLFLSDIAEELDAASEAGMRTCLLLRGGEENHTRHTAAKNFNGINPTSFA